MVALVAQTQTFVAPPPGLELPVQTEVPTIDAMAMHNCALTQANAGLEVQNAILKQKYMELRLVELQAQFQMGAAIAAASKAVPLEEPMYAKPTCDLSDLDTEPPSFTSDSTWDSSWVEEDEDDEIVDLLDSDDEAEADEVTVVVRNVPLSFTRETLMALLDREGFSCKYNFLYLPFSMSRQQSLGYAIINLQSEKIYQDFFEHFHGVSTWGVTIEKAQDQGLDANIERFRNCPVMHKKVPDACKPVILERGVRAEFPAPTVKIQKPPTKQRA
jgi:hypothetical protein